MKSATVTNDHRTRITYILYVVGFLDFLGIAMIIPLVPRHTKELGASSTVVGLVGSLYGGIQLFSGPIVGKWSDVVGRRWSLLWCFSCSAIGYAILGFSSTISILIISRLVVGVFKHTMSLGKAYMADITPKDELPAVYGKFNAISGLGFIIGPTLGGHIAEIEDGFMIVCLLAAAMFLICYGITWYFITPLQTGNIKRTESEGRFILEDLNLNPFTFFKTFRHILIGQLDLFIIRFLVGFAVLIYRSNFTLMLEHEYGTSPKMNGYIISFGSAAGVLSGMLVGRVIEFYQHEGKVLLHASILQFLVILALTFAPNIWVIMFLQAPLSFANALSRVTCSDLSIRRGRSTEIGAVIGLSQSVMSVARMITPAIGGIIQEFSYQGPGILAANFALAGIVTLILFPQDKAITKEKSQ